MDWLLVATAIRLVTAVGSVDIQEKEHLYVFKICLCVMPNSPIGIDLCVVISLGPDRLRLMLNA